MTTPSMPRSTTTDPDKQFRLAQALAIILLVVSPLIYLGLGYVMELEGLATGYAVDLTAYLLLAVAILQPSVYYLIERSQIQSYRDSGKRSRMTPGQVYLTLTIVRLALVEAIYVFALVVYFVTASYQAMLYFYPVGILWSLVHWPRRRGYEQTIQMLGAP